eukprot:COSAG02_NODE_5346_length_4413_cov_3.874594_1_plen_29_part_10
MIIDIYRYFAFGAARARVVVQHVPVPECP